MKVVSPSVYYTVFVLLLILLALTVGVAYIDLGAWNPVAALLISTVKATLVVLYFMHVRYGSSLRWLFAGAGFLWLFLLIVILMADYLTRPGMGVA
ncbi:MAG: cytochrome C oxidase subunit IV family protein [Candidatus Omnitrophica bacterium]|nr:cytochrome C oxidase subunit IV family protein [Candidatus Omnitrophota bacterium]